MQFEIENLSDISVLNSLGVDVFPSDRNYWFIRTQNGKYYDDFVNDNFVGIEWNEIIDIDLIKSEDEEALKRQILDHYPKTDRPGYPVNQILRFANKISKGDIVLIPNKNSDWITFGEFLDDNMYIYEEDDFESFLYNSDEEDIEKKQVLKKRRNVKWIKTVKKTDLDPNLYGIIYSHSAIWNASKYSNFIDKALSQFYVKGDEAYFTYKVKKKNNIPYSQMLKFLNDNNKVIEFINKYSTDMEIDIDELVLKVNAQSEGTVQIKGGMKKVLVAGLVIIAITGGKMGFEMGNAKFNIETPGVAEVVKTVNEVIMTNREAGKIDEYEKISKELRDDKENLQLELPETNIQNIEEEMEIVVTEETEGTEEEIDLEKSEN